MLRRNVLRKVANCESKASKTDGEEYQNFVNKNYK
jgi:hypothetical protein